MPRQMVRALPVLACLATAFLVVACAAGGPPESTGPTATSAGSPPATVVASTPPAATASTPPAADPTPVPTPATSVPPVAILTGERMAGEPPVGSLGTYTWGDNGTDAPWIVPEVGDETKAGTPLQVSLDPAIAPASWTARWAPVAGGAPGDVASSQEGSGPPSFLAPDGAGDWSLQVEARFGEGHSAVWYWRIEVR